MLTRHRKTSPNDLIIDETLFATQNNYLGVRGNFEEGIPYTDTIRGTYINGFYDTFPIDYGEWAYGFAEFSQTIVNLPDAQTIQVFVNDTPLDLSSCTLLDLKRYYNIKQGYTKRVVTYETKDQSQFKLTYIRRAHHDIKPLFSIQAHIQSLNYTGKITIRSTLNGNVQNTLSKSDPRLAGKFNKKLHDPILQAQHDYGVLITDTKSSGFQVFSGMTHSESFDYTTRNGAVVATKTVEIAPNKAIEFNKYAFYYTSQTYSNPQLTFNEQRTTLSNTGFDHLIRHHEQSLNRFNQLANIGITSVEDEVIEETINYGLYQLYTAGGYNSHMSIAAKGMTGEGYEGHVFWDTEIYMFPFFMQVEPSRIINMLTYRYNQLDKAKKEAQILGASTGVKFAWRTINGEETSAYYPAGAAQYHINSDLALAVIRYYQLYEDRDFMKEKGLEILIETARFFKHVVHFTNGEAHLHQVTGPDEYTALVDNNYYTNSLLKYHLEFLLDWEMQHGDTNLSEDDITVFTKIVNHIVLIHDKHLNIDVQDQSFMHKKPWNFKETKNNQHPLLLHFHPLNIYRHQVLKQPDTVLSHMLLDNRPMDVQDASYDFYEPLTTHDSSLSHSIHAIQAAKLGRIEEAYAHFKKTVTMDVDNTHGNTEHGLHLANIGGMYQVIIFGFIGYRYHNEIAIAPQLPKAWKRLNVNIRGHNRAIINVDVQVDRIHLRSDTDCVIRVYQETINLKAEEQIVINKGVNS